MFAESRFHGAEVCPILHPERRAEAGVPRECTNINHAQLAKLRASGDPEAASYLTRLQKSILR